MMKLDLDLKKIASEMVLEISIAKQNIDAEIFGFFKWRKHLALLLFRLGASILRMSIKVEDENARTTT